MSWDLPDWAYAFGFGALFLIVLFSFGWRNTNHQIAETVAKRPNPTREEFLTMMAPDVSAAASEFLWQTATECLNIFNGIAPHPTDSLVDDLPIDDEEWSMDWPGDFAEQQGFSEEEYPDWPDGWPVTFRNYGKWLDMGLAAARKDSSSASSGEAV